MKKQTFLVKIALLVWQNASLPIATIHSAGGEFCVSGDRRLRELHALYIKERLEKEETAFKAGYHYDGSTPKQYIFRHDFRMFCKNYFITHRCQMEIAPVRVQVAPETVPDNFPPPTSFPTACAFCGAYFRKTDSRPNKVFCSARCRVNAWRVARRLK
jgi:hypothetical protein